MRLAPGADGGAGGAVSPAQVVACARMLAPVLAVVHARTGVPESTLLAMVGQVSGWRAAAGESELWDNDPWAVGGPSPGPVDRRRPATTAWSSLTEAAIGTAERISICLDRVGLRAEPPRAGSTAVAHPADVLDALSRAGWPAAHAAQGADDGWAVAVRAYAPAAQAALAVVQAGVALEAAFQASAAPLGLDAAAELARAHFAPSEAATLLAIAVAASGLDPRAVGGSHAALADAALAPGLCASDPAQGRPRPGDGPPPYTCFGLWQINTALYARALVRLSRAADPAVWAIWLFQPTNNAVMAAEVYGGRQKLNAWPAYADGSYRSHLAAAQAAVAARGGAAP